MSPALPYDGRWLVFWRRRPAGCGNTCNMRRRGAVALPTMRRWAGGGCGLAYNARVGRGGLMWTYSSSSSLGHRAVNKVSVSTFVDIGFVWFRCEKRMFNGIRLQR